MPHGKRLLVADGIILPGELEAVLKFFDPLPVEIILMGIDPRFHPTSSLYHEYHAHNCNAILLSPGFDEQLIALAEKVSKLAGGIESVCYIVSGKEVKSLTDYRRFSEKVAALTEQSERK
ncbi:MAG: hypothetical protein Q7J45_01400 [bacterium]|nr:hypothetical protein [bacterium]